MARSRILGKIRKLVQKVCARARLGEDIRAFVDRGQDREDRRLRRSLVHRFRHISASVRCAHSENEMLLLADFLLSAPLPGPIVECGCFKGGSTAKLSLVARATGRRLLVCDSFEGLPSPAPEDRLLVTLHHEPYARGMFAGALHEVQANLARAGAAEVCTYHKGYFNATLPQLTETDLSCIFIDVDLISSARDCLGSLWPRLASGGRVYLHEARDLRFLRGILNASWWQEHLGQAPPLVVGAGHGLGDGAPQLAYLEKEGQAGAWGRRLTACCSSS
jgi:predicted O-methyltransferase YrrM